MRCMAAALPGWPKASETGRPSRMAASTLPCTRRATACFIPELQMIQIASMAKAWASCGKDTFSDHSTSSLPC